MSDDVIFPTTKSLLASLEDSPESVQLHHGELERLIRTCMDTIYELSVSECSCGLRRSQVRLEVRPNARFKVFIA